jgi:hypothetical protein
LYRLILVLGVSIAHGYRLFSSLDRWKSNYYKEAIYYYEQNLRNQLSNLKSMFSKNFSCGSEVKLTSCFLSNAEEGCNAWQN